MEGAPPLIAPTVRSEAVENTPVCVNDIPAELLDDIFEYLRYISEDHKATLFACSLVSRMWRETTLRHRFYALSFRQPTNDPDPDPDSPPSSYQLLDFVATDAFFRVQNHVRYLSLHWPSDTSIDLHFAHLVNHFPELQSLKLRGLLCSEHPVDTAVRYEPIVPHIRVLIVHANRRDRYGEPVESSSSFLCGILRQFASLDELQLRNLKYVWDAKGFDAHDIPLPETRVLTLRGTYPVGPMNSVIKRLAGQRPLKRLELLECSARPRKMVHIFGCLDATPEHIRFDLADLSYSVDEEARGELSLQRDLRRLTVVVRLSQRVFDLEKLRTGYAPVNSVPWEDLNRALATLDSRCLLENMHIGVAIAHPREGDPLPATKAMLEGLRSSVLYTLETLLLQLRAEARLTCVMVALYKDTAPGRNPVRRTAFSRHHFCPAEEYLRALFPRLDAAGILNVKGIPPFG